MSQVEWQQVKDLFYTALTRPDAERASFLDSACGTNKALRSEIEVLLDSYESDFLEGPLLADAKPRSPGPPLFEEGHTFSHYEIVRLLGRGGMGEVYLADDTALGRQTAIKIIHNESGFGDQAAARLLREARAAAKLDHPNICSVYEVGETDGSPFIAMQYVEGEILDSLIADGSIGFDDAVSFARQIAAALAKAHSFGIVHRDIKPSNVIVDARKHLTVLDFGLAKETLPDARLSQLSEAGLIAGTVTYMSPEHLRGQEVDEKTDIWSLGVLFYQMLTGRLPFRGESKADLIAAILNNDPEAPVNVPAAHLKSVNSVFERALNKGPALRYPTIEAFDADLAKLAANQGIENLPVHRWTWLRQPKPALRYALLAILVLALGAGGIAIWQNSVTRAAVPFSDRPSDSFHVSSLFDIKRQVGGAISDLSFSPNGKALAFALSDTETSSIYVLPVEGGTPLRLTSGPSSDRSPVWSPDGSQIGYLSVHEGTTAIRAVPAAGGDHRLLMALAAEHSYPRLRKWSNDGKQMFIDDGRGPQTIDLHSGVVSALALGGIEGKPTRGFSISPDESKLMVASIESGKEQLWYRTGGSDGAKLISESSQRKGMPEWFPDNNSFAYSADADGRFQIYIRDLDGNTRQITSSNFTAASPVVSPDGRQIAYVSNIDQANIYQTDIDSGKHAMLTQGVNMHLFPTVSHDGRHLAYQALNDSTQFMTSQLKLDLLTNDEAVPRPTFDKSGCCLQWSPDGEELAYIRRNSGEFNIFKAGLTDSTEQQVTTSGISFPLFAIAPFGLDYTVFGWSPDGSRIAFISRQLGKDSVWTVATDGSNAKMIAEAEGGTTKVVSPTWSPDGSSIAFLEADTVTKQTRIVVSRDGQTARRAEFSGHASLLDWSELGDGVFVATAAQGSYRVVFVPVNEKEKDRLIAVLADSRPNGMLMSPDRRWISYTVSRDGVDNLCITSITKGNERCVTSNDDPTVFYSGATWTPDSRSLLYSKQTGGMQISLISLYD